jgi:signal transduction histidine kinase
MLTLKKTVKKLVHPRSSDEDSRRKEFILNILLLSSITLFAVANVINVFAAIFRPASHELHSMPFLVLVFILAFFSLLYFLSRKGHFSFSAHVLVFTFFFLAAYMGYHWGVDITASLLIYGLVIVMAGILVSTRFAFLTTALIGLTILITDYLQGLQIVIYDYAWRVENWETTDTIMTAVIFFLVAIVSWLSNREIERSLARAHRSEASLRKERDMLEITVEERTRELKEAQLERISQLYSLAEFGRLSSGLFHDLMNPLTAVSLNVEKAKSEGETSHGGLSKAQYYLDQAFVAAKRMERFIVAVRKQIGKKGDTKRFSLRAETKEVIDILSYKAHLANVRIILSENKASDITGDPIQWSQTMLNLISNSIDAYDEIPKGKDERTVVVTFTEDSKTISCAITDHGIGIPKENMEKIFDPFFTTKMGQTAKGTGIGLSTVKRMIEKNFNGSITVESAPHIGTTFLVVLPK